jgi:transposase InsO family protein
MIDTGCLAYGVISESFAKKQGLSMLEISPVPVKGINGTTKSVRHIVRTSLAVGRHYDQVAYFYVLPDHLGYDLILGLPWLEYHDARVEPRRGRLYIKSSGVRVWSEKVKPLPQLNIGAISASVMGGYLRRTKRRNHRDTSNLEIFAVTMADIEKALSPRKPIDPRTKLPAQYQEFISLFSPEEAGKLPPYRGEGIDHKIELMEQDGKEPQVPWGPLYKMSTEELLVLRKTLTELLDKNFIRVSHSPAAAPVLFVRKPGGGLRFCVDYRALNAITKKDRYPLPLIHETLNQISRAKWFTKLDVSAAFHKIRIAKGEEWKTAFRTRYGLFEWLVTPFGLANAPSSFQKYINLTLRDYLDDFCSAYLDDVLIYSSGTLKQHQQHVKKVLAKLAEAGLHLDISKCEFECKETRYLGFIVRAGEGIQMDPKKVKAILGWATPSSVKGVRGFLGFANFYRNFIQNYSEIVRPLVALTHKDVPFTWSPACDASFQRLKRMFTTGPILVTFDPSRTTIVESDSSGYTTGGVLSQYDDQGLLRPCAYFSKKNAPAECNYEIYDKELLAVVRCLEAWDAELRSVQEFTIITDHKNLEYFFKPRRLTERHVRWSLFLSRFNFTFQYRRGSDNARADALSRREQDNPDQNDPRIESRTIRLLAQTKTGASLDAHPIQCAPFVESRDDDLVTWEQAREADRIYQEATRALANGARRFPPHLHLKVSISECTLDYQGYLRFRGRRWVPNSEPLRTTIIQSAHDSTITGHPGREETYTIISREFFWPRMSSDIRRFVRNCDLCGGGKVWRELKKGLLKPLPVPERPWQDIALDFVTDLPTSNGHTNILVITDRLTKGVILEGMGEITAETTAWAIIRTLVRRHGFPLFMVSDRGVQFTSALWTRVCQLCGIVRRLSTAYHPETDGQTERWNSTVETYLRFYVYYDQDNWSQLLPMAELALNGRVSSSTGMSPFFLGHGYNLSPFQPQEDTNELSDSPRSPAQAGEAIVRKLAEASDWARASIAYAAQTAETQANRHRDPAPAYHPGDYVWLNLKNIKTDRPCRKLDWKNAKYIVRETIGSHAVRLNTPPGIHPVFHVNLLRPAARDPFPSQRMHEPQPPAIVIDDQEEWEIEEILDEFRTRHRRNPRIRYLVKWTGYTQPTREPAEALSETIALDRWLTQTAPFRRPDGSLDKIAFRLDRRATIMV